MWPVQKVRVHPTGYEWGKTKEKNQEFLILKVHRLSRHQPCGDLTKQAAHGPSLSLVHWQTVMSCVSRAVVGVHKLTSRTSVGVLDWSCCSLALLPALTPVSCRYCWPCCRLAASTRSICSWHALRQSWNKRVGRCQEYTHTHAHTYISVTPLLVFECFKTGEPFTYR